MSVVIYSRDMLEPVTVEGSLLDVVNHMNIAQATGKAFTIFTEAGGPENGLALELKNITRMRMKDEEDDAIIGR